MAAERMNLAERRERARERIANDPERREERLSLVDRDAFDVSKFDDDAILNAFKGGTFDKNDFERLTGKSSDGSGGAGDDLVEDTDGDVTVNAPITITETEGPKPPKDKGLIPVTVPSPGYGNPTISQIVDQSRDFGKTTFTGNVVGDGNSIDLSKTDNSTNTVGGNKIYGREYLPDFMKMYLG